MNIKKHAIGQDTGRWRVLSDYCFGTRSGKKNNRIYYFVVCECSCGTIAAVRLTNLESGSHVSCGCYRRELGKWKHAVHVDGKELPEHLQPKRLGAPKRRPRKPSNGPLAWLRRRVRAQVDRCRNPSNVGYANYGGRGIEFRFCSVAEATVYYHSLPGCGPDKQLDRIDNNGHYEVGNVRWVTRGENCRNRRGHRVWRLRTQWYRDGGGI